MIPAPVFESTLRGFLAPVLSLLDDPRVTELMINGASEVFVFGSAVKAQLRPNSDIDMAVSGLPALVYFSAISQASDLIGRPVDLVDLDDDSGLVRYLRGSGELVRVA